MMRWQRGNSMAETAIVMTLLLALIFAILYFGRVLYTFHAVTNGARLGSRYAMVRGTSCTVADCPATVTSIQTYVRSQMPLIDQANMTVTTQWSASPSTNCVKTGGSATPGNKVCVTVLYPFTWQIPLVPSPTINITSTSIMIMAQ